MTVLYPRGWSRTAGLALCAVHLGVAAVASAQEDWRENLIDNASFETGEETPTHWFRRLGARLPGPAVDALFGTDDSNAKTGTKSLYVYGDINTTVWPALESRSVPIVPGRRYQLAGWIKTDNVAQEQNQYFNCNFYVQFIDEEGKIVNIGLSPVAASRPLSGTHDWTRVETITKAPAGARFARVGCALTCSGGAWFDDVSLREQRGIDWQRREADGLVLIHEPSDGPADSDIASLEKHLRAIEKVLNLKHAGKIKFYKYSSTQRKIQLTGIGGDAHFEIGEVHASSWNDRHEIVHILMEPLSPATPFLAEGIAVHLAARGTGDDVHASARLLVERGWSTSLTELFDPTVFRSLPAAMSYKIAGSFVAYLVDKHGIERFKKVYTSIGTDEPTDLLVKRFREAYGLDLTEATTAWRAFLLADTQAAP